MRVQRVLATLTLGLALGSLSRAQDLASFEKRTHVKVLPNGLTLIVCERPDSRENDASIRIHARRRVR